MKVYKHLVISTSLMVGFLTFVVLSCWSMTVKAAKIEYNIEDISLAYTCKKTHGDPTLYAVCDGDTFKVNIKTGSSYAILDKNLPIRLYGLDAPEYYSPRCENELVKALEAKQLLTNLLGKGTITLKKALRGKYYRLVADVHVDGTNVRWLLLDSGYYQEYNNRKSWCTMKKAIEWSDMDRLKKRELKRDVVERFNKRGEYNE